MSRWAVSMNVALCTLLVAAGEVRAIGWGPTDFLIDGGPGFTSRIGVFDSNLSFKGYLDSNFGTVHGLDFDAAGNLVAVAPGLREVRVYDTSGARVGGFIRQDNALSASQDLNVWRETGDYLMAEVDQFGADGARRFTPSGAFVQQYSSGAIQGVAVVPGNLLWVGTQ